MSDEKSLKYNEPWILQRADPYVYRHTDGSFYFTASVPAYDGIVLRRAGSLAELSGAEEVMIWKKHESGPMSYHIWAPEIHYLFGKWYIYFAGGEKEDIWKIRPYVLECSGDDPLTDEWVELGKMKRAAEKCGVKPQLLVDLQGPELRTGTISAPVSLKNGDIVEICGIPEKVKDSSVSGADRKEIAQKSENKDIEKIPAEKNTFGKGSGNADRSQNKRDHVKAPGEYAKIMLPELTFPYLIPGQEVLLDDGKIH